MRRPLRSGAREITSPSAAAPAENDHKAHDRRGDRHQRDSAGRRARRPARRRAASLG
ncbi:MAG TPA: hypothetical protein VEP91_06770 [Solirubrobacterales bacterium]|nr:hypothetical protein [Solirubrobacterales bacterium]